MHFRQNDIVTHRNPQGIQHDEESVPEKLARKIWDYSEVLFFSSAQDTISLSLLDSNHDNE